MVVKYKLENLTNKLTKMSTWKIILISFAMTMIITFLQQIAFHLWGTIKVDVLKHMFTSEGLQEQVYLSRIAFFGIMYIPIIETLIYQTLIMNIFFMLNYEFEYKIGLPVIVSSLIFGLVHWKVPDMMVDSIIKAVGASLIGLVLAYSYAIFHLSNRKATLYTVIIHGLLNLYSAIPAQLFIKLYDMF